MAQILHGAFDLALRSVELVLVHQGCCPRQTPAGTVGDGQHHIQIPQQFIGDGWRLGFGLLLRFEKQLRLLDNPLPYRWRRVAPGRIELTGLPAREPVLGQAFGQPLAVLDIGARHRHQILHGDVCGDGALAHFLLHTSRKQFHQRQSPRHPTQAPVKPPRQVLQAVTKALFQFGQQPALFQRRFAFRETHRAVQDQGLGFAHLPNRGFHRVPAQLLQSRDPLVAIDDRVMVRLVLHRDDHDRHLLARCG